MRPNFSVLQALKEVAAAAYENANEAQVRHDLINDMLHDCLGWPKGQGAVEVERREPGSSNVKDYILRADGLMSVVVEAKRLGRDAPIPWSSASTSKPSESTLGALRKSAAMKETIEQALKYCREAGAPVGVATDGNYYVIFKATTGDGTPPDQSKAFIFPSLSAVEANFQLFCTLLSFETVRNKKFLAPFYDSVNNDICLPKNTKAFRLARPWPRTDGGRADGFQIWATMLFAEMPLDDRRAQKEYLEKFYCPPGIMRRDGALVEVTEEWRSNTFTAKGLEVSAARTSETPPRLRGAGPSLPFIEGMQSLINSSSASLVFSGRVGAGKTSLIKYLTLIELENDLKNRLHSYIDLRDIPTISDSDIITTINSNLYRDIEKHYKNVTSAEFLRALYREDIERYQKSFRSAGKTEKEVETIVFEEKELSLVDHLIAILKKKRQKNKAPLIILDNLDQHSHATQLAVLSHAFSLARRASAILFVTVWPETLELTPVRNLLKTYNAHIFSVEPPRIDQAFRRKIGGLLKGDEISLEHAARLSEFVDFLEISFDTNEELGDLFAALSNDSVREAYSMLLEVFKNRNLNFADMFQAEGDDKVLTAADCVWALGLGSRNVYSSSDKETKIRPIFSLYSGNPLEYLVPFKVLDFLEKHQWVALRSDILTSLDIPLPQQDVEAGLEWMCRQKFLEKSGEGEETLILANPFGFYHYRHLAKEWYYYVTTCAELPFLNINLGNTFQAMPKNGIPSNFSYLILSDIEKRVPDLKDHVPFSEIAKVLAPNNVSGLKAALNSTHWRQ